MATCYSGGAIGADIFWGKVASEYGHDVKHFVFENHRYRGENNIVLTPSDLEQANEFLIEANKTLKRSFPTKNEYVNNLLRRNYFQIKDSDSVYAVSEIKDNMVQGGTAWAVQMFLNMGKTECYVYDQVQKEWFYYENGSWLVMGFAPETPTGSYAGIGTRKLNSFGEDAIFNVFY